MYMYIIYSILVVGIDTDNILIVADIREDIGNRTKRDPVSRRHQ